MSAPTTARTTVEAAGALVWRMVGRRLEVLLVHRPRYDDWGWPKGKLDPGEGLTACAVREVAEETGLQVALGQPLPTVRYHLGDGRRKHSHYWAAQVLDGADRSLAARPAVVPAEDREIDDVRWVEAGKAAKLLTYHRDRVPLGALLDQWHDERLRTWTMVVVRHARARKRSAWPGDEATRPLTAAGQAQAAALVPLLSAYGVEAVITSPWERCAATVRPYLEATGLEPQLREELTEAAHKRRAKPVRELVRQELTTRDRPVALCMHRPVLPTVVAEIAGRTPHRIMQQVPDSDPWLKTGEALVVHVAQRPRRRAAVVALEKHRPPS
ncbi:NUDIX hydrolase [Georgenia sp. TF02-10]|uniref:NUDIX hydrolase n=1 Tax=Georgenia sp. TF02-10 TaxID=2917725 RepID=UPI001FA73A10|nr:NUDIX hydrolase [Georgenia sp. TF02-10]UNX54530.1 NUDIX hydrolase [Georgenia sp. TF02-10]